MISLIIITFLSVNLAAAKNTESQQNSESQQTRGFLCKAETVGGETSTLKVAADTGDVSINYGNEWLSLYTTGIYCGLKMKAVNCQAAVTHNFDSASKPHDTLTAKYNCKIGGIEMTDANGYVEINIAGDGNGYFICGRFAKNDLLLSNCQTTTF
jgi:hypothetical protein